MIVFFEKHKYTNLTAEITVLTTDITLCKSFLLSTPCREP